MYNIGPMGENIVVTELLWRGWLPANLNSIVRNSPNVDILATKNDKKTNMQVKTSTLSESIVQVGYNHSNKFINNKEGPLADFIIFVRIENPKEYETYIVPVEIAELEISKAYKNWMATPKKDGSKRSIFPASIYFKPNKNRPADSNYIEKWAHFKDAWHLLET